ncbi:MAG: molybdopterin-dependent oxidoreductase [Alkalimonas sp.]|nr:molybdopterin-dependent oxidoreductase [Alkalimonas sp.]
MPSLSYSIFIRVASLAMFSLMLLPQVAASEQVILTIKHSDQQQSLTLDDLDAMPQQYANFQAAWGPSGQWQGVYLHQLLQHYSLQDFQDIRLNALNEYRIRLTPQDIQQGKPILATRFNGEPIPLEKNGPIILIWPQQADQVLAGTSPLALWIWSLSEIRVRP